MKGSTAAVYRDPESLHVGDSGFFCDFFLYSRKGVRV